MVSLDLIPSPPPPMRLARPLRALRAPLLLAVAGTGDFGFIAADARRVRALSELVKAMAKAAH